MIRKRPDGKGMGETRGFGPVLGLSLLCALILYPAGAQARDAAFVDPGSVAAASDDAVKVEPKNEVDVGDSVLNVARRVDLFFVNQSGGPVKVEKVTVTGDGNVATEIAADDCSKQGTIQPGSRCNVEVSLTPSSPGPWTADVLMTHDGAGRIARAKLSGKTAGTLSGEKKDMGLALNTKESNPVNFGDVEIDGGKIVRSALMVNDSTEPITLYSIDVIEASNGLQRLDQGCAVDMELKPGESCPVTLVWTPQTAGQISTDLIIRHSGRLGFAVIPIRGVAKGVAGTSVEAKEGKSGMGFTPPMSNSTGRGNAASNIPPPPSAQEVAKAASGKVQGVAAAALAVSDKAAKEAPPPHTVLYLIGTVGNRAVILKPDGKTAIVNSGDTLDLGETEAKVLLVSAKSVDVFVDGMKRTLVLEAAPELVAKATKAKDAAAKETNNGSGASNNSAIGGTFSVGGAPTPIPAVSASGAPSGGTPPSTPGGGYMR